MIPLAVAAPAAMLPIAKVAQMLSISERTLYRMVSTGEFPQADFRRGGTSGRRLALWRIQTIEEWMETNVPSNRAPHSGHRSGEARRS